MKHKWTILFLVHAGNKETRVHVNELFSILIDTKYKEEIKVLLLYGGLQSSVEGYKIQVTLSEIVKDASTGGLSFSEVNGYGVIDIGDDKNLNKIFHNVRLNYPSERFLLFTWDHGSGFGIFKTNPQERAMKGGIIFGLKGNNEDQSKFTSVPDEDVEFKVITNNANKQGMSTRDFADTKGIKKTNIETSMLTNDELRNIIEYEESTKKVDLLIMMNCAMQMVETGYALQSVVEYLVAPETCIFWAGYNYRAIINKLCDNPDIETEAIARYSIDTVEICYREARSMKYFNDLVISLVKPARAHAVKKVIDEIATRLIEKLPDSFMAIKTVRQKCEDLTRKYVNGTPYQYVDFLHCINALQPITSTADIGRLKEVMHEYTVQILKGKNYQHVDENSIGKVNGCTIYYPETSAEAKSDYYYGWFYKKNNQQTLFAADCLWKDFLLDYVRHDREGGVHKKNIS